MSDSKSNAPSESYWVQNQPNVPRFWSASSLATLADCPRRFELSYVEGWVGEESAPLSWGKAYHEVLEQLDTLQYIHSRQELYRFAVRMCLSKSFPEGDNSRTPYTLLRAVVYYLDKYENDPFTILEVNSAPAIEMHFRFDLDLISADGEPYIIQGYLDEFRELRGEAYVWERKTTGKTLSDFYFDKFKTNFQTAIYTIGAQVVTTRAFAGVILDACQTLVGDSRFERRTFPLTEDELDEYLEDIKSTIRSAERYADADYYPKNPNSCGFCDFKDVCSKPPKARYNWLKGKFTQKRRETVGERT